MSRFSKMKFLPLAAALGVALHCHSALACAACYGSATGPLADGLNWGIFSLLGVVVCVLGGIASFAIFLARRAASVSAASTNKASDGLTTGALTPATQKA